MKTDHIFIQQFKSRFGKLIIGVHNDKLCLCDWKYRAKRQQIDERIKQYLNAEFVQKNHELIDETVNQLNKYFIGDLRSFTVPIKLSGTDFQKSVWNDLMTIPYGKTLSYGQLSRKRNNPKSIRAIAAANSANAISILIPCHRIIGSDGSLVGYAGGLKAKEQLLKLEGVDLTNGQQQLF
ncbi:methylated-DNA--[protein]-cysteine S-methyltransferase [Nonlabens ponticola]|uniref:methylated-DNA--[protein]-cysteine S-methyltransferase n=1 Tax=Nonlabens ponticola TaxID=2496866 RepID=A0A3S9MZ67_9FLAO|nr:methylated-DNA--[protein]-cysteine S-methyltransferase [Nonlabens ponticola]AZQ44457.1 methylated-DNA--[protein]-cysteine S-methyltransferase [Nonlabens ponticola]